MARAEASPPPGFSGRAQERRRRCRQREQLDLSRNRKKLLYFKAGAARARDSCHGDGQSQRKARGRRSGWDRPCYHMPVAAAGRVGSRCTARHEYGCAFDLWTPDGRGRLAGHFITAITLAPAAHQFARGEAGADLRVEMRARASNQPRLRALGGDHRRSPALQPGHAGAEMTWHPEAGGRTSNIVEGDPLEPRGHRRWASQAAVRRGSSRGDIPLAINGQSGWMRRDRRRNCSSTRRVRKVLRRSAPRPGTGGGRAEVEWRVHPRTTGDEKDAEVCMPALQAGSRRDNNTRPSSRRSTGDRGRRALPCLGRVQSSCRARGVRRAHRHLQHSRHSRIGYAPSFNWRLSGPRPARTAGRRRRATNGVRHTEPVDPGRSGYAALATMSSRGAAWRPIPTESVAGRWSVADQRTGGERRRHLRHSFKLLCRPGWQGSKRTWVALIGISRHPLVDGTITTQPEYSFWPEDVGECRELRDGIDRSDVDFVPQDCVAGRASAVGAIAEAWCLGEHSMFCPTTTPELRSLPAIASG